MEVNFGSNTSNIGDMTPVTVAALLERARLDILWILIRIDMVTSSLNHGEIIWSSIYVSCENNLRVLVLFDTQHVHSAVKATVAED
jgi:hypothetical protein